MHLKMALTAVLISPCLALPVMGAQKKHRPWLMIGGSHHSSASRHSSKVARRPAPSPVVAMLPTPSPALGERAPVFEEGDNPVVHRALQYQGTRYHFGGTSPKGLDCSGLVSRVYEDLKLKQIPRASAALYKAGKPVSLEELRPGDLVFFKNTYRRGISHVGIYTGHNKFVHAANHKRGVTLTAMSDPYYQLHYAGARRIY